MKVLVTGGAGFIGSHLVDLLVARGMKVRVLDSLINGKLENLASARSGIEFMKGDIRDRSTVRRAVRGAEVVFHLAALGSVPRSVAEPVATHDANTTGTFNVLNAARERGVRRVVYSSTSAAYGDQPTLPKHEGLESRPLSPYAVSKLAGEYYLKVFASLYNVDTVSLRYFNVYGPRQDPKSQYAAVMPRFFSALLRGKRPIIYGDGGQTRDFTFVRDCVDGTSRAGTVRRRLRGEVINIAGGRRTSVNRLYGSIQALCGSRLSAEHVPSRPGEVRDSLASIHKARALLGFRPAYDLRKGLEETHAWYAGEWK